MKSIISYFKKLLFVGLVASVTMSAVFASGAPREVIRGDVIPVLSWVTANARCQPLNFNDSYPPSAADLIRNTWSSGDGGSGYYNGSGSKLFGATVKVLASPSTYNFYCVVPDGESGCNGTINGTKGVCWDSATLIVKDCQPGSSWDSTSLSCKPMVCSPGGQTEVGCTQNLSTGGKFMHQCKPDGLDGTGPCVLNCPTGYSDVGGTCVVTPCPNGCTNSGSGCNDATGKNYFAAPIDKCITPSSRFTSTPYTCVIGVNQSSCKTPISWTIPGGAGADIFSIDNVYNPSGGANGYVRVMNVSGQGTNSYSTGGGVNIYGNTGTTRLELYDRDTQGRGTGLLLDTVFMRADCDNVNVKWYTPRSKCAQCVDGKYWDVNDNSCKICPNGGCNGTGGNPDDPDGNLICNNGAGNPPTCSPLPGITSFTVPSFVNYKQTATLSFVAEGTCQINGVPATSPFVTPELTVDTDYTLSCTNGGGTVTSGPKRVEVASGQFTSPPNDATCVISRTGNPSTCVMKLSWDSVHMYNPIVKNSFGALLGVSPKVTNLGVTVDHNGTTFTIYNGSFPHHSIKLYGVCDLVVGDVWNGTECVHPSGGFDANVPSSCEINNNNTNCTVNLSWTTNNLIKGGKVEDCNQVEIKALAPNSTSGNNSATVPYSLAGTCYRILANLDNGNTKVIDTIVIRADCKVSANLVWDASAGKCVASSCSNGCVNAPTCNTRTNTNFFTAPLPGGQCLAPTGQFTVRPLCNINLGSSFCDTTLTFENDNGVAQLQDCGVNNNPPLGLPVSAGPNNKVTTTRNVVLRGSPNCFRIVDVGTGIVLATIPGVTEPPLTGGCLGGALNTNDGTCSAPLTLTLNPTSVDRYFGEQYTLGWISNANIVSIAYNGVSVGAATGASGSYTVSGISGEPALNNPTNVLKFTLTATTPGLASVSKDVNVLLKFRATANIGTPTMNNGVVTLPFSCLSSSGYDLISTSGSGGNLKSANNLSKTLTSDDNATYTCPLSSCPTAVELTCKSDANDVETATLDLNSLSAKVSTFSVTPNTVDRNSINNNIVVSWSLSGNDSCYMRAYPITASAADIAEADAINAKIVATGVLDGNGMLPKSRDVTTGSNILTNVTITSSKTLTMICGDTLLADGTPGRDGVPDGIYATNPFAKKSIKLSVSTTKEQ